MRKFNGEWGRNLVYYYLNQSYPLFAELKSIIFKTSGAPKMLQNILEKFDGISQAFIYGSLIEAENALKTAEEFVKIVLKLVQKENPQLK